VQSEKPTNREELWDSRGYGIVEDEGEDSRKSLKATLVIRLVRGGEAVALQSIGKVTIWAVGGAWFEGTECLEDQGWSN
jgi:hypothetical protein